MAAPARNLAPYKGKMIQLIHIAKSKLNLDDATYRAILEHKTGKSSSKGMSMSELEAVLEHMRGIDKAGLVFTPKPASKAKAKRLADDPQSRKIRSLWLTLRDLGAIQDSSEQALGVFVKRQTGGERGVERLEWLNNYQATRVIESLKQWVGRIEEAT
jgi:phage gp16-like protein